MCSGFKGRLIQQFCFLFVVATIVTKFIYKALQNQQVLYKIQI